MNKFLLSLTLFLLTSLGLMAQTVILDFETDTTSRQFQYFGSTIDGTLNNILPNPDPTGINMSPMVADFVKPPASEVWAGAYANPGPTVDLSSETTICVDVWFNTPGNLALKLENGDRPNWVLQEEVSDTMQWVQLCFNTELPSMEDPFEPAAGGVYTGLVLFFDFGMSLTEERSYFFDNVITQETVVPQTVILDFETDSTSRQFQYFGSTIDGTLNNIIPNPDPNGINMSPMVADFMKPPASQSWAGAFANPGPTIDLTSETTVCVDVWFNTPGNLALKLEFGDNPNWVLQESVEDTMQWVQLCFNTQLPSIEEPFAPAAGGVYTGLVLFFDFNTILEEERTYYFDNVITRAAATPTAAITFSVDMNEYTESFTTPYVSGTFNNWSENANPLEDADGDGVWTGTITGIPVGAHEYKFQLDGWNAQEQFIGTEVCTVTDTSGQFTNRRLAVTGDETLPAVCFNSCFACGDEITITVNLGQGNVVPSDDGFFIAGGNNFGIPGDFPLTDPDGDGVHTIVLKRQVGFSSYYTFANGACGDFSCKENIGGQDCANPDNFNDRFMGPISQDTVISTCFGLCTTTTECGDPAGGTIEFNVDMSDYTGSFTTVFLSGNFNGWSADANPLSDDDGDGIWTGSAELVSGSYEYKFQLDGWATQEEFTEGDPCTVTSGGFTNRALTVTNEDFALCFKWNTCETCEVTSGINDLTTDNSIFIAQPNPTTGEMNLIFGDAFGSAKTIRVINAQGQVLMLRELPSGSINQRMDLNTLSEGLYFVHVVTDGKQQTQRILIQR